MPPPKRKNPQLAQWKEKQKLIEAGLEPPVTMEPCKPGVGRPHKELDVEQIERLAMIQCTMEEIAACMHTDVDTIITHFSEVIEKGKKEGKKSLRRLQFEHAKKNAAMAMFLGKVYLDQVDNPQPQGPLKIVIERRDGDYEEEIDCNF